MSVVIRYASLFTPGDKLVTQSDLIDERYVYKRCPAFTHKHDRTFVGISPIDFNLRVGRNGEQSTIYCNEPDLLEYDEEHIFSPQPVIQLRFPKFLFWTHQDDVWFEFNDHPMTSYSNNFIAVPGWFNLSNWSRAMSLAITIVDETKPVKIRKGDPLFRVSFYSPNLDSDIIMKQELNEDKITEMVDAYNNKKLTDHDEKSWRKKLFAKTGMNKCPFSFLYK